MTAFPRRGSRESTLHFAVAPAHACWPVASDRSTTPRGCACVSVAGDRFSARGRLMSTKPQRNMLVIDGSESPQHSIVEHYRSRGWQVRWAATTKEAIDVALDLRPTVIVMDLSLADANTQNLV